MGDADALGQETCLRGRLITANGCGRGRQDRAGQKKGGAISAHRNVLKELPAATFTTIQVSRRVSSGGAERTNLRLPSQGRADSSLFTIRRFRQRKRYSDMYAKSGSSVRIVPTASESGTLTILVPRRATMRPKFR